MIIGWKHILKINFSSFLLAFFVPLFCACNSKTPVNINIHAFESDLAFSTIEISMLDPDNRSLNTKFTGQSNEYGRLNFKSQLDDGVYVVKALGGSYLDFSSKEFISLSSDEYLLSHFIVDSDVDLPTHLSLSPYTSIATMRAIGIGSGDWLYTGNQGYTSLNEIVLMSERQMQDALGFDPYRTDIADMGTTSQELDLSDQQKYRLLMEARSALMNEWYERQVPSEGTAFDHFYYTAIGLTQTQMRDVQDGSYLDGHVQFSIGDSSYISYGNVLVRNGINQSSIPFSLIYLANEFYEADTKIFDFAQEISEDANILFPAGPQDYILDELAPTCSLSSTIDLPLEVKFIESFIFYLGDSTSFSDISINLVSGSSTSEKAFLLENGVLTITVSNSELYEHKSALTVSIADYWGNEFFQEYDIYSTFLAP